jgi:hypothetical protein
VCIKYEHKEHQNYIVPMIVELCKDAVNSKTE